VVRLARTGSGAAVYARAVRISVALACRNGEHYVGALLDSLARQTEPPHELVVHDDASEDSTPDLVEQFRASAPFPVRLERGDRRLGGTEAFIRAARRCGGDAIAFCDQDDVWLERKLAVCGRELERSGASLVMHSTRPVDAELHAVGDIWPAIDRTREVPALALTGLDVDHPGMAMVFRPQLLDAAAFEARPASHYGGGRQMLHDEWIFFLAGVLGPIRLVAEPLVLYRHHGSNDSGGRVDRRRTMSLRPAGEDYVRAAKYTAACADYLERAGFEAGAREYRRASRNWALRTSLYSASDRLARARLLRRLLGARAYRGREAGGFGRAALAKDLAAGLVLAVRGDATAHER
jgi:glycosyltransferase involved in cell wall biosynthesis